jgi:arylsulfatase A-like enzyme
MNKVKEMNITKFYFHPITHLLIFVVLVLLLSACSKAKSNRKGKPNIIFILADDMGYGDMGAYGQKMIQTPHLDSIAAAGMRFTDYYAGSTVCAPSRESLLTGYDTGHTAIRGNFRPNLPMAKDHPDIAELLKKAGYQTALFGKWGVGELPAGPNARGFDYSVCYIDQMKAHNYYPPYLYENGKRIYLSKNKNSVKGLNSHDLFVKKTLQYIDTVNTRQPFFLYLPYTYPHGDYEVPINPIYEKKDWHHSLKVYASMVTALDQDVNRIMQTLKKRNLLTNTLVLFTSDNGANLIDAKTFKSNGNLRGGKRSMYEGGIREPLIVYWKGKIKPNRVSHHITAAWDMLPTFCQVAHINSPKHIDGISFLPTLLGREKKQKDHKYLYWEYYQYNYNWHKSGNKLPRNYLTNRAVRFGKWKAVQNHIYRDKNAKIELYDLQTDPSEKHNIANEYHDVIKKVEQIFKKASVPDPPYFPFTKSGK